MAHPSASPDLSPRVAVGLGREKFGVIVGFLTGLAVGIGPVQEAITLGDAPLWLNVMAVVSVVAVFTRLGLRLAR